MNYVVLYSFFLYFEKFKKKPSNSCVDVEKQILWLKIQFITSNSQHVAVASQNPKRLVLSAPNYKPVGTISILKFAVNIELWQQTWLHFGSKHGNTLIAKMAEPAVFCINDYKLVPKFKKNRKGGIRGNNSLLKNALKCMKDRGFS